MAGIDQRDTELVGNTGANIAGVGIVIVDYGRIPGLSFEIIKGRVGKVIQTIPEQLFCQIALLTTVDAHDLDIVSEPFKGLSVISTDRMVNHPTSQQVNMAGIRILPESPRQFHHLFGLAAGVGIASELQVVPTN